MKTETLTALVSVTAAYENRKNVRYANSVSLSVLMNESGFYCPKIAGCSLMNPSSTSLMSLSLCLLVYYRDKNQTAIVPNNSDLEHFD